VICMKRKVYSIIAAVIALVCGGIYFYKKDFDKKWEENRRWIKQRRMFKLADKWMEHLENKNVVSDYFNKKGYKKIAVYGMSTFGQHLIQQLKNSNIEVRYGIDRRCENIESDISIYSPEETLPDVDVVVVTAIYEFEEIKKELKQRIKCPIISLEEVIYEG